jgi:hypothetical protein
MMVTLLILIREARQSKQSPRIRGTHLYGLVRNPRDNAGLLIYHNILIYKQLSIESIVQMTPRLQLSPASSCDQRVQGSGAEIEGRRS